MKTLITKTVALLSCAALIALMGACNGGGSSTTTTPLPASKSIALVSFASCDELEGEIKSMLIGEMERNLDNMQAYCRYADGGGVPVAEPFAEGDDATEEQSSGEATATATNVQEAGVDEADLVKSDGTYAYALVDGKVRIVRVWPFDQFGEVATITPQGQPRGIYLAGTMLIVLSDEIVEQTYPTEPSPEPMPAPDMPGVDYYYNPTVGGTIEEVYDVADPTQPVLIKSASYAGRLLSSRRIDAALYLALESRGVASPDIDYDLGIDYGQLPLCSSDGEAQPNQMVIEAIERLKAKNRQTIRALTLAELMPDIADGEISCLDIKRCTAASGTRLLTVVADAFADADATPAKTALLSNGGALYASRNALYVTATSSLYGWWAVPDYEFTDSMVIHRFALDESGIAYTGSGEVAGHLVDNSYAGSRYSSRFSMAQFAMSEYEGYLRVATTVDQYTANSFQLDNRVYVLDAANTTMETVGSVAGLGTGERIYAVRFIGPRGYVVTFKKVDPLYVVDLSIPTAPAVTGELKVPGFSTYLHPWGEDQLIGLGFAADDEIDFAWTQGLKLAQFDVSDSANPFEVGNREIGSRGSYSAAIEEHHAFNLSVERGMLALPVEIYEGGGGSTYGTLSFRGVMIFNIDGLGQFETLAQIAMAGGESGYTTDWWGYDQTDILRTVIIGDGETDGILTLARNGIQMNRLDATNTLIGVVQ